MESLTDNEYAFTDLTYNETNVNSSYGNSLSNNNNSENENSLLFNNYSEYIVPPEKEGSPFAACASILFKSDLKILYNWKWILQGIVSSFIIAFGCLGNLMAVIILWRPKLRSAFNQLLITLCITDTIFLISNIMTAREAFGFKDSETVLSYMHVTAHVSMCASVFMMVALTLERHFAICSPHAYRIHLRITPRWKHLTMYIVPVSFLALFVNIPMFINLQREWMENALYVKINLYLRALHPLTTTGLAPVIILAVLNVRICRGISVLNRKRQNFTVNEPASRSNADAVPAVARPIKNRNRRHIKEISATYTAIAIVSSFVVLHLPRILASTHEVLHTQLIITCIEAGRQYIPPIDFYKVDFVARMLMVVNSAINFLIYCAVSSPFQSALFDVFCPCVPSHKRPGHGGHARTRSAHPDVQPRSLNLGVLFRTSNNPPNATPISFDGDVVTPGADPSLNGTIVVTSSYVETRFVSPPNGSRHQLQIHSPEANNVFKSETTPALRPTLTAVDSLQSFVSSSESSSKFDGEETNRLASENLQK